MKIETQNTIETIKKRLLDRNFSTEITNIPAIRKNFFQQIKKRQKIIKKHQLELPNNWGKIKSYGNEKEFMIIDLGGTFLKFFLVEIKKDKLIALKTLKIDFYQPIVYTPQILFSRITKHLLDFLGPEKAAELTTMVFVFSFPMQSIINQFGNPDGVCLNFSKAHKSVNMLGLKIGEFFQRVLRQNGLPQITVSTVNDAVIGVLAAKQIEIANHQKPFDAVINLIVGTGTNLAYGTDHYQQFSINNTEFGQFKYFPASEYDKNYQKKTELRGQYHTEKLYAGKWRKGLFEEIMEDLINQNLVDGEVYGNFISFCGEKNPEDLLLSKDINEKHPFYPLKFVWNSIARRGGAICGLTVGWMIDLIAEKIPKNKPEFAIVLTGGVLEHSPPFHQSFIEQLQKSVMQEISRKRNSKTYIYNLMSPDQQTMHGGAIFHLFSKKNPSS